MAHARTGEHGGAKVTRRFEADAAKAADLARIDQEHLSRVDYPTPADGRATTMQECEAPGRALEANVAGHDVRQHTTHSALVQGSTATVQMIVSFAWLHSERRCARLFGQCEAGGREQRASGEGGFTGIL